MLYRSDERYYGKTTNLQAENVRSNGIDTDMPLSKEERDRIYEDHVRIPNEFVPEGSNADTELRLPKEIAEGLDELTDLQREVIFRSIVNEENVSVIAKEKDCSARNIRDIRARALKVLRAAATKGAPGTGYPDAVLFAFWGVLVMAVAALLLVPDSAEPWMRTAVFVAFPIVTVIAGIVLIRNLRRSPRIRKNLESFEKKR